jgi:kumamolisin
MAQARAYAVLPALIDWSCTMTEARFIAVPGSERTPAFGATATRAADAEAWLEVTLKLARKAALPAVDARPRKTLTAAEVGTQYGASDAAIKRVSDTFTGLGLTLLASDAATRTVKLGGPVRVMEQAFQVRLMQFDGIRGPYRGRIGALHVPSALENDIVGVFGLDNRRVVRRRPDGGRQRHAIDHGAGAARKRPWFFPAELAAAYDFPDGDGSGQTIGLLEFGGGYFADDLAAFGKAAGLASLPTVVPISVDKMPTNTNDEATGEVMLDVEVLAGICPKATIPVWFSQFTEKGWVDALDAAMHDPKYTPQVLSISWGYAEDVSVWTAAAVKQVDEALQEAALMGITICVAAGDDGSSDGINDGHAHVDFPCASPFVLAVGGTLLRTGAKRSEHAWKDGDGLRSDNGGSTGGGVSQRIARPAWQAGLDIAPVNPGQAGGRIVPDVAANASANTGYFVVAGGQQEISGGTSASAPLWAALVARMNQQLAAGGKRVGYLTPLLYGAAPDGAGPLGKQGCNDIHAGDNITAHVGGFKSAAGFDAVTGWGSPKGKDLLAALTKLL